MGELSHSPSTEAIPLPPSSAPSFPLSFSLSVSLSLLIYFFPSSPPLIRYLSPSLLILVLNRHPSLSFILVAFFFIFLSLVSSFSSSFRQTSSRSTATTQVYHIANVHTLSEQLVLSTFLPPPLLLLLASLLSQTHLLVISAITNLFTCYMDEFQVQVTGKCLCENTIINDSNNNHLSSADL